MTFKATGEVAWKPDGKLGPVPVIKAGGTFDLVMTDRSMPEMNGDALAETAASNREMLSMAR